MIARFVGGPFDGAEGVVNAELPPPTVYMGRHEKRGWAGWAEPLPPWRSRYDLMEVVESVALYEFENLSRPVFAGLLEEYAETIGWPA